MQAAERPSSAGAYVSSAKYIPSLISIGVSSESRREHATSGLLGKRCSQCDELFEPSALLFSVAQKNYQDGHVIEREWEAIRAYLGQCFMLTVFGYSAPETAVEAVALLKEGWGAAKDRSLEQTEIITRPGSDHEALLEAWEPFIHSHHYEIHESFYDSWLAHHPRRTGGAYRISIWMPSSSAPTRSLRSSRISRPWPGGFSPCSMSNDHVFALVAIDDVTGEANRMDPGKNVGCSSHFPHDKRQVPIISADRQDALRTRTDEKLRESLISSETRNAWSGGLIGFILRSAVCDETDS